MIYITSKIPPFRRAYTFKLLIPQLTVIQRIQDDKYQSPKNGHCHVDQHYTIPTGINR